MTTLLHTMDDRAPAACNYNYIWYY